MMAPTFVNVAGEENVKIIPAITGAEDFAFFAEKVPSLFYFVGGRPLDVSEEESFPHHTPDFFIDDSGIILGVKTLSNLALDYSKIKN